MGSPRLLALAPIAAANIALGELANLVRRQISAYDQRLD
jgi:hypothetical protein